jgi:hypothetical protein
VCLRRSTQVGRHLAHVLLSKQHGGRPVTLVGYSLGARVVFYCLKVNSIYLNRLIDWVWMVVIFWLDQFLKKVTPLVWMSL